MGDPKLPQSHSPRRHRPLLVTGNGVSCTKRPAGIRDRSLFGRSRIVSSISARENPIRKDVAMETGPKVLIVGDNSVLPLRRATPGH